MPLELEEFDYREDPTRLIYLGFSILEDVYEGKYYLGFKDYCLFAALYYHIKVISILIYILVSRKDWNLSKYFVIRQNYKSYTLGCIFREVWFWMERIHKGMYYFIELGIR